MKTIEELLRMTVPSEDKDGNPVQVSPEFRVAVQGEKYGGLHIILHPFGLSGDTIDCVVTGNRILNMSALGPPDAPRPRGYNPKG